MNTRFISVEQHIGNKVSNPHRTLALMHKRNVPDEPRSLDELEAHYRSLSMGSQFARLAHAYQEADAQDNAAFEARVAIHNARRVS